MRELIEAGQSVRRLLLLLLYLADETKPAPRQGLQKDRCFRIVAECLPQVEDVALQNLGLHMSIRPNGVEKFILSHQPPGALNRVSLDRLKLTCGDHVAPVRRARSRIRCVRTLVLPRRPKADDGADRRNETDAPGGLPQRLEALR